MLKRTKTTIDIVDRVIMRLYFEGEEGTEEEKRYAVVDYVVDNNLERKNFSLIRAWWNGEPVLLVHGLAAFTHDELWEMCTRLPGDYEGYGETPREREVNEERQWGADCSSACLYYHMIEGIRGFDWGLCANPKSHRYGLLTFEHQGCWEFVYDKKGVREADSVMPEGWEERLKVECEARRES